MTIQKSVSNGNSDTFRTVPNRPTTLIAVAKGSRAVTGSFTWPNNKTTSFSIPKQSRAVLLSSVAGNGEDIIVRNTAPTTEPMTLIEFTFSEGR